MSEASKFSPRLLFASEYVLALHDPQEHVAVLVRNRSREQTMQEDFTGAGDGQPSLPGEAEGAKGGGGGHLCYVESNWCLFFLLPLVGFGSGSTGPHEGD